MNSLTLFYATDFQKRAATHALCARTYMARKARNRDCGQWALEQWAKEHQDMAADNYRSARLLMGIDDE